jgi:hypothetical protein
MVVTRKIRQSGICMTFAIAAGLATTMATATELPTAKLDALQCAGNRGESCCQRWVNVVLDAARAEKDPSSMLTVLPRRVERWLVIEKRSYCAMKTDIEARDRGSQLIANN